ncbi:MAG: LON peptidase substrate-binding domain-containing protein, partial [Ilumatobacteraceae bacterium]
MAMFPLGLVLVPGALLPLHVFEPRYRDMVRDRLADDGEPEFGQVLITRGREAGGGDERASVGTIAQVLQIEALDEQRYAMLAVGTRRFKVIRWLDDDPYPMAEIEDWPDVVDDVVDLGEQIAATGRRVDEARHLATRLGDLDMAESGVLTDIADDSTMATHHLAALAPIGPADRYRLLEAPGPAERLVA